MKHNANSFLSIVLLLIGYIRAMGMKVMIFRVVDDLILSTTGAA